MAPFVRRRLLGPRVRASMCTPVLLLAALAPLAACGDDDDPTGPSGIQISDLAGTWVATQFLFVPSAGGTGFDPTDTGSVTLVVQPNGSYTLTAALAGGTEVSSGRFAFDPEDSDFLLVTTDGEPGEEEFFFTLTGNQMRLFSGATSYDFDGDGTDEPASLEIIFERD